jgi:hypothetical protein
MVLSAIVTPISGMIYAQLLLLKLAKELAE